MHGLLWVWLLASVRRRSAVTGDAHAEPVWAIDLQTVEVDDLSLLPGFTKDARERIRKCRRDKTGTLSVVQNILGQDNACALTNLNIALRWGGPKDPLLRFLPEVRNLIDLIALARHPCTGCGVKRGTFE